MEWIIPLWVMSGIISAMIGMVLAHRRGMFHSIPWAYGFWSFCITGPFTLITIFGAFRELRKWREATHDARR